MTFTLEERNAIKASISHWEQDIQARFLMSASNYQLPDR